MLGRLGLTVRICLIEELTIPSMASSDPEARQASKTWVTHSVNVGTHDETRDCPVF